MQTVPNFGRVDEEMDLLEEEASTGRVLFSAIGEQREILDERVSAMRAQGLDVTGITVPRSGGGVGGLSTNNFFWTPSWRGLRKLDFDSRLDAIRDESFREKLVAEVRDNEQVNEHVMRRPGAGTRWATASGRTTRNRATRAYSTSRKPPASIRWRHGCA